MSKTTANTYYLVNTWTERRGDPSGINSRAFEALEDAETAYKDTVADLPREYGNECRSNPSPHITMAETSFWIELGTTEAGSLADAEAQGIIDNTLGADSFSYADHCANRRYVVNSDHDFVDYGAAVNIMDDDLREELHANALWNTTDQEFFDAYCEAHLAKFGEEFAPNAVNGQW